MGFRIGVVLSGCGFKDGAEIHESVCALLALDQANCEVSCFAPDIEFEVIDHRSGEKTGEKRNVLAEAARIARGEISDLKQADPNQLDALVMPGGFGAASNLSDFAAKGEDASVLPELQSLIQAMFEAKKPILAICIAPALVAKALGSHKPKLTIGTDQGTASALEGLGASHQSCPTESFVVDEASKIITTPAYMLGPGIRQVNVGISRSVGALIDMLNRG